MCPVLSTINTFSNIHYPLYTHHLPNCPVVSLSYQPCWLHSHFHLVHVLFDDCIHLEIIMIQYKSSFCFLMITKLDLRSQYPYFYSFPLKDKVCFIIFLTWFLKVWCTYSNLMWFELSCCKWLLFYHNIST